MVQKVQKKKKKNSRQSSIEIYLQIVKRYSLSSQWRKLLKCQKSCENSRKEYAFIVRDRKLEKENLL